MANTTHGAIKLSTADSVSRMLMKKLDSQTGFKPSEWTDNINLLGALPIRTASGTIAHFEDGADDVPCVSVVANIEPIQEGSGTPSPSNPRPISGTDELTLIRTGKNLNGFTLADFQGGIVVGNARFIGIKIPKSTITYSSNAPTGNIWVARDFTDITTANNRVFDGSPVTYDNVEWLCIGLQKDNMETAFAYSTQAELGNTATDFETYTGTTYTIDLGQEIMGGTADVVGGVGEKTHGIVDLGDLTWTYRTDVLSVPCFLSSDISDIKNGSLPIACSCFEIKSPNRTAINGNGQVSIGNNTNAKYLVIRYDEYTDGTAVKTALTGQKLVYELATPTEYTFTGQPINSYLGVNNVYVDSGEVLDVEYRADIDLLIAELET